MRYYTGAEDSRTNLGTRQISRGAKQYQQTFYSVNYTDIREHRAGFCDACDLAEWDAKEANWPKPKAAMLIGAIIGFVALAVAVLLLVLTLWHNMETVAAKNMSGLLMLLFGGGIFALFGFGSSYLSMRKEYVRHRDGYRAPMCQRQRRS